MKDGQVDMLDFFKSFFKDYAYDHVPRPIMIYLDKYDFTGAVKKTIEIAKNLDDCEESEDEGHLPNSRLIRQ